MQTLSQKDFLAKYGPDATLSLSGLTPPAPAAEPGFASRVATDITNRGNELQETLATPASTPSQALALGTKATATAFGGISDVLGEAIKSVPGGKQALDAIGGASSSAFKYITDKLSDTAFFKEAAAGLEPNNALENTLSAAASAGDIANNILAADGVAKTPGKLAAGAEKVANKVGSSVKEAIDNATPVTKALYDRSTELVKPAPSPSKAMGEVLQAKNPITPREVEAFKHIDTDGVKTYSDLEKRMTDSIGRLSEKVDEHLSQDPTPTKLSDFVTKTTSGSGRVIERNFVETALDHLKELYQKTADDAGLAYIEDVIAKASDAGLTAKEVNDISRLYNAEFGGKAFSKITGEPLTSVNAQAYENIRTGLKDVARQGIGGAEAKAADKVISSLYNTRDLVTKNVAAVQKLNQRIAERGLLEKTGNIVAKYGDVLTGGTLRGLIGGLLPRGAGYKILNALDLEERLARNLKIIREAIESGSDEAIVKATKELESSVGVPTAK